MHHRASSISREARDDVRLLQLGPGNSGHRLRMARRFFIDRACYHSPSCSVIPLPIESRSSKRLPSATRSTKAHPFPGLTARGGMKPVQGVKEE